MNKITQRGFSLVEMLMALLVASLLLAALAPVITRKMHSEQIDISAKGDLSEKKVCGYVNDTFEDIKAEDCTAPNDAHFGSAIIVSGGGGGAGAVDTVISANKVLTYKGPTTASNTVSQSQYEFEFNKNINTIFIKMAAGGGGGGGGNYNANFAGTKSGCEKITGTDTTGKSSYAAYDNINKLCVTKYNQVSNPSDYTTYKLTDWNDTKCTSDYEHSGRCNANKNNMAYTYSGCNRPVCTHSGAEAACNKLSNDTKLNWRLPNKNELKSLSHAKFAMCTSASSGTMFNLAAYCNHSDNYVYNSVGGSGLTEMLYFHAHPYEVWTKEAYATNNYWGGSLQTYWDVFPFLTGWPLSVRCVADSQYNLFIGGGGGGSSLMTIYIPQEVIKYVTGSANTGLIKIYAGAGGKGGAKQSTVRGSAGSPSRVEVYAKHASSGTLTLIWALQIEGGYAASGASTTNGGGAGGTRAYGTCSYLYKSIAGGNYDTEVSGQCANLSLPDFGPGWGSAGRNGNDATNPGGGGNTPWPNNQPTTPVNTAGVNGSGGGGGICSVNNEGAVSCTDGGNGGPGVVEITYTTKAPGIGGSGGGAGGLAHIVNFEIQPGTAVKIQAGKRGKGGGSGADGNDGGESYVEINGKKYSVSGGTGGKAGTAGIPPSDNTSSPTMPKAGNAGIGGKSDIDKTVKFDGEKGSTATIGLNGNMSLASGGNGGINPKISMFADIPCGGLSTTAISGVACNRSSNMPALLMRTLTKDDFNSAFKSTYAAGATGGGGGGWNGNLSSGIKASSGADGLGGYVFVYFGPW